MRVNGGLVIHEEAIETEEEREGGVGGGSSFGESGVGEGVGVEVGVGVEESSDGGLSMVICGDGSEGI
jgi:hypothetical protein